MVKVMFELPTDAAYGTESLWAEPVSDGYELRNSPFYVYGVSFEDIVDAEDSSGQLRFCRVVRRGGHSTYRVFLRADLAPEIFARYWAGLAAHGCSYESTARLLTIDVPPGADISAVFEKLEAGETAGIWEFEEAHCGHPVRSD